MDLSGLTSIYTDYMKTQSDNNRLEKMKADWKERGQLLFIWKRVLKYWLHLWELHMREIFTHPSI